MVSNKKNRDSKKKVPVPSPISDDGNRQRLVRVVSVGSSKYIAIGRIAPDVEVGDLLLAVFYPKTNKITLTPYEAVPVKSP